MPQPANQSRPQDDEAAMDFAMGLQSAFKEVRAIPTEAAGSVRAAANLLFSEALYHAARRKRRQDDPPVVPLVYLDPHLSPCKRKWLDQLQSEWFTLGQPVVMAAYTDDKDSTVPPDLGPAIVFSPEYVSRSALLPYLKDGGHWRRYLAWEIRSHAVKSGLLGDGDEALLSQRDQFSTK